MYSSIRLDRQYSITSILYDYIERYETRKVVDLLQNKKPIDLNVIIPEKGISVFHFVVGCNPMSYAEHMTKLFLEHDANPNVRNEDGLTPVHVCAAWGRSNILNMLLTNGGDPFLYDNENKNAFYYALENKHWTTLELLERFRCADAVPTYEKSAPKFTLTLDKVIVENCNHIIRYEVKDMPNETKTKATQTYPIQNSPKKKLSSILKSPKKCIHLISGLARKDFSISDVDESNSTFLRFSEICDETCEEDDEEEEDVILQLKNLDNRSQSSPKVAVSDIITTVKDEYWHKIEGEFKNLNLDTSVEKVGTPSELQATDKQNEEMLPLDQKRPSSNAATDISAAYLTCDDDGEADCSKCTSDHTTAEETRATLAGMTPPSHHNLDQVMHSMFNVSEEYVYTDIEDGSVIQETRTFVTHGSISSLLTSDESLTSDMFVYDSDALRKELRKSGYNPGPITFTTKRVYLKKLSEIQRNPVQPVPVKQGVREYSQELLRTLDDPSLAMRYKELEAVVREQFANCDRKQRWREGMHKSSFTYLLLDPRISNNLPGRFHDLSKSETWTIFLNSIFYIGKGKTSRPYSHLHDALSAQNGSRNSYSNKIRHIQSIWKEGFGVICVMVFHSLIPVEAYTREAAMIDALGLVNLKNERCGEYYGKASLWSHKDKRRLGVYLLYQAMSIFLSEGERQLKPVDIK